MAAIEIPVADVPAAVAVAVAEDTGIAGPVAEVPAAAVATTAVDEVSVVAVPVVVVPAAELTERRA